MSRVRRLAPWSVGLAAVLLAAPCQAQGNIDAGKTPAQIFSDTCTGCHRSARELKRASASFLRQHYTAGSEEASAMAGYLAGLPAEPRPAAAQPKRPPAAVGDAPAEAGRPQPKQQQAKQEPQPKQAPQPPAEQARSAQLQQQAKGGAAPRRPGAIAEARPAAAIVEDRPSALPAPAVAPAVVLEPFEE